MHGCFCVHQVYSDVWGKLACGRANVWSETKWTLAPWYPHGFHCCEHNHMTLFSNFPILNGFWIGCESRILHWEVVQPRSEDAGIIGSGTFSCTVMRWDHGGAWWSAAAAMRVVAFRRSVIVTMRSRSQWNGNQLEIVGGNPCFPIYYWSQSDDRDNVLVLTWHDMTRHDKVLTWSLFKYLKKPYFSIFFCGKWNKLYRSNN